MEQQFHKGSLDTTYKMTRNPTAGGVVQSHTGRTVNLMKNRRNKSRHLVLLVLVAFFMLAPQVQENVFEKWAPGLREYVMLLPAPYHIYPNEATFTVAKTVVFTNNQFDGWAFEDVLIPLDIHSLTGESSDYQYTNGEPARSTTALQEVLGLTLLFQSGSQSVDDFVAIPTNGSTVSYENRITTSNGHSVWWPEVDSTDNRSCPIALCVKMELALAPNEIASFSFQATVKSTSYSWWDGTRVDTRIAGISDGINIENSGTFDDIAFRGGGQKLDDFTLPQWYDRGASNGINHGYAINAQNDLITQTASLISASLPEGRSNNAYAYSRAVFDYLHEHVTYDKEAPDPARSGPACLEAKTGDCDEQTNAFLSLLRVKNIPGWYVFGALTDGLNFEEWEGHGWGYILLPMSESWCASKSIVLDSCFVEASVDVVNNKWLLHTPNAYISWIEEPDMTGDSLRAYYSPGQYSNGVGTDRTPPVYSTVGDVDTKGGKYQVKILEEWLR